MLGKIKSKHSRKLLAASSLAMSLILILAGISLAVYRISRPITEGGGVINQGYLYGEQTTVNGAFVRHKGIDFIYPTGTHVYAVADGTVVDLANGYQNEERISDWGNFVLIRHDQRYYDRTTDQWAYVYSMYLHLSQWSVRVAETNHVSAGDWIADSDDTGSGSGGQHFHLQIVVNSQSDRTLEPSTLESETRSRNPELWLNPYNGNTGTVVGKVTDVNGNAVGNRLVCGLQKDGTWGYRSNLTYVDARFNPDDILYENWGTTDVTPGLYAIYTCPYDKDILCGCANPISMGEHTVQAGRVTYVGLFPVWLPYVFGNYNGWNSSIIVHNNSDTYQAQVHTTFFNQDGTVRYHRQDDIPQRGSALLTPLGSFAGSALVVSSEDIGVVVENRKWGWYAYAYTGQSMPDTTGYLPQILQKMGGVWDTNIQAMNTGVQSTNITVNFYKQNGATPSPGGATTLANVAVNGSGDIGQTMSNGDTLYVGRMSAAQPVAGVVRVSDNSNYRRLGYSTIPVADTTVWLPFVMTRLGNDWGAAIWIQNTTGTASTVYLDFSRNGTHWPGSEPLPANGLTSINLRTDYTRYSLPAGWYGSLKLTASVPMAVVVNQLNDGASLGASYEGVPNSAGSTKIVLPYVVRKELTGQCFYSNFTVRNLGTTTATVKMQYYNLAGNGVLPSETTDSIWTEKIYNLYTSPPTGLPDSFRGSVMITSTTSQPLAAISNLIYYPSTTCTTFNDSVSYTGVKR